MHFFCHLLYTTSTRGSRKIKLERTRRAVLLKDCGHRKFLARTRHDRGRSLLFSLVASPLFFAHRDATDCGQTTPLACFFLFFLTQFSFNDYLQSKGVRSGMLWCFLGKPVPSFECCSLLRSVDGHIESIRNSHF